MEDALRLTCDGLSVIEIDLRQPSMLHGKKGFEKIVWAFKNVLNQPVTWLFHDVAMEVDSMVASKYESGKGSR